MNIVRVFLYAAVGISVMIAFHIKPINKNTMSYIA
jgi:hypothetical protein